MWHVEFGSRAQLFGGVPYRSYEDGFVYVDYPEGYAVIAWSDYGNEYIHEAYLETEAQAERLYNRIRKHFDAGGEPNLEHWNFWRVQYGTQAYLDEEPEIVAREKADALADEACPPTLPIR